MTIALTVLFTKFSTAGGTNIELYGICRNRIEFKTDF